MKKLGFMRAAIVIQDNRLYNSHSYYSWAINKIGHKMIKTSMMQTTWTIFLMTFFVIFLTACTGGGDQASISAQNWFRATTLVDTQVAKDLTCNSRLNELNERLLYNQSLNIIEVDTSQINFVTTEEGEIYAIVIAKGQIFIRTEQGSFSWEVKEKMLLAHEADKWQWCGDLEYSEPPTESSTPLIIGGLVLMAFFLLLVSRNRQNRFAQFFTDPNDGTDSNDGELNRLQPYEIGWIKSFNKLNGAGYIANNKGENHIVYYSSIIGTANRSLVNGEKVLFQKSWSKQGLKAVNVIKVKKGSGEQNSYSGWLINLAVRVKQLVIDFRIYKIKYVRGELNTCKAFLEEINAHITMHNVKLENYEIVLFADIEKDLSDLTETIRGISDENNSSFWGIVLVLVLQMVDVIADIIQLASPQTAMLLRSLGRGVGHLLTQRPRPHLLGPKKD